MSAYGALLVTQTLLRGLFSGQVLTPPARARYMHMHMHMHMHMYMWIVAYLSHYTVTVPRTHHPLQYSVRKL